MTMAASSKSKVDIDVEPVVFDSGEADNGSSAVIFWERDNCGCRMNEVASGMTRTSPSRYA